MKIIFIFFISLILFSINILLIDFLFSLISSKSTLSCIIGLLIIPFGAFVDYFIMKLTKNIYIKL